MKEVAALIGIVLIILVIGFFIGTTVGESLERRKMQKKAVELHHAHYGPETGEWKWNDPGQCGTTEKDK